MTIFDNFPKNFDDRISDPQGDRGYPHQLISSICTCMFPDRIFCTL